MGALWQWRFPKEVVDCYPVFIETGVGRGDGLSYAEQQGFKSLISIEADWPLYADAVRQFAFIDRVAILYGDSKDWLQGLLDLGPRRVFFWLDAHFPGHDHRGQPIDAEHDLSIRLPLVEELRVIDRTLRRLDYCILIDDLRFYADDDWGNGNLTEEQKVGIPDHVRNLDFLDPFRSTHAVEIYKRDAGYALIRPHGKPGPQIIDG